MACCAMRFMSGCGKASTRRCLGGNSASLIGRKMRSALPRVRIDLDPLGLKSTRLGHSAAWRTNDWIWPGAKWRLLSDAAGKQTPHLDWPSTDSRRLMKRGSMSDEGQNMKHPPLDRHEYHKQITLECYGFDQCGKARHPRAFSREPSKRFHDTEYLGQPCTGIDYLCRDSQGSWRDLRLL